MKKLITTLCLKLLNWTGYTIPLPHPIPIKPTIISPEFSKRARAEEKINFYQLEEWATHPGFDYNEHIQRRVKEALAMRIAGDIETFTIHTPDGIIYRADVVFCDMAPYEKDLNLNGYEE